MGEGTSRVSVAWERGRAGGRSRDSFSETHSVRRRSAFGTRRGRSADAPRGCRTTSGRSRDRRCRACAGFAGRTSCPHSARSPSGAWKGGGARGDRFGGSKGNFVAPRTDETAGKRTKKNRFIKQTTATLDAPTRQISRVNNATSTLNPYGCPISRRHRGAHLREARPPQPRRRRRVFIARATLLGQLVRHSPP